MQPEMSHVNETEMIPVHMRIPGQQPELSGIAEQLAVQSGLRIHPSHDDDSFYQSFTATGLTISTQ
jgi:hypothetical protein